MRGTTVFLIVSFALLSLACTERQKIPSAFVGTWQSDESLTLTSMSKSQDVSQSDKEMFSNDFFGDRVMEFQIDRARSYFVGDEWEGVEQDMSWHRYDVVASGPDFMTLRLSAEDTTWRIEGKYIYAEIPKWNFREYWRRVDESE